jgi:RNA polymerase sigma factor (TIGR02999 family)
VESSTGRVDPPESDDGGRKVDELFPELYAELRRIAHAHRRRNHGDGVLSTTAVVSEAYIRLRQAGRLTTEDRLHFLAVSARAMRFVLIDYARRSSAGKRGHGLAADPVDGGSVSGPVVDAETMLAINAALKRLTGLHHRMARVVECRFFGGMTDDEIARLLGVSERTVRGDWTRAKIWLARDLGISIADP